MGENASVAPLTIESFYKFVGEGKLMGAKCDKCGKMTLPPRPVCTNCFSKDLKWVEVKPKGQLLTYTVIYVAPKYFETLVPYAVGIIRLEDDLKLLGMIRNSQQDKIRIGMNLIVDFEKTMSTQTQWPSWPRYFFTST